MIVKLQYYVCSAGVLSIQAYYCMDSDNFAAEVYASLSIILDL